jgi:hypothetical protein
MTPHTCEGNNPRQIINTDRGYVYFAIRMVAAIIGARPSRDNRESRTLSLFNAFRWAIVLTMNNLGTGQQSTRRRASKTRQRRQHHPVNSTHKSKEDLHPADWFWWRHEAIAWGGSETAPVTYSLRFNTEVKHKDGE